MPKIKCTIGPTVQYVLGSNYAFERDDNGDFTCMVFDDKAAECFLASGAYVLVGDANDSVSPVAIEAAIPSPVTTERTKKDAVAEAKALGVAITQRMSLAEIDAAIADHQAKLQAELIAQALAPQEPALDPDGNPSNLTGQPGGEEALGEQSGGENSADSADAALSASDEPDPDVSDDD